MISIKEFISTGVFGDIKWGYSRQAIIDKFGETPNAFLSRRIPSFIKYEKVTFFLGKGTRGELSGLSIDFSSPPCLHFGLELNYDSILTDLSFTGICEYLDNLRTTYTIINTEKLFLDTNGVCFLFKNNLQFIYKLQDVSEQEYFYYLNKIKKNKIIY